jgi:hypothetical protein
MPTQRDLGSIRKKDTYSESKNVSSVVNTVNIDMSKQFYRHKKRSYLERNLALFVLH